MVSFPASVSRPKISVCVLTKLGPLADRLYQALADDQYTKVQFDNADTFFDTVRHSFSTIDCFLFEASDELAATINRLHHSAILLPAVILTAEGVQAQSVYSVEVPRPCYHTAETYLAIEDLDEDLTAVSQSVQAAISKFLRLSPQCRLPVPQPLSEADDLEFFSPGFQETLSAQQHRLSEKIKERLGYLGIFYKRDANLFFRNLAKSEQAQFLTELKQDYREIILVYFQEGSDVNQKIDAFVNKLFFSDLSVSQVLEIHMEFMDLLAKKLKLEGRSEDALLDYRLTLIDAIAHLCEMYRRSVPRKP
jgi:circadian clock protein KaiA